MIDINLRTPQDKVKTLQTALHAKAKAEPTYRFYSLWDKIYREDILTEAYRNCRANKGSHGADGETFSDIEAQGTKRWLGKLQEELRSGQYTPQPLRRVWIPKAGGKKLRPLSICCIKDRVVQATMLIVLNPIFEADLLSEQYGFRGGLDAKMAIRRVYFHVTQYKRYGIVDADLQDYFMQIPHGDLLKCITRRIADKRIIHLIKQWLVAPVIEREDKRLVTTTQAKDSCRGIYQGSPLSPLLSNCYFRRFVLAWKSFGYEKAFNARVVNYADDSIICCNSHAVDKALKAMRYIINRMGLSINEEKTKTLNVENKQRFDFLGYTFGTFYDKHRKAYYGTRPSQKALSKVLQKIHEVTDKRWLRTTTERRIEEINPILRGWCTYFNQGPVAEPYKKLRGYTEKRLRRWLVAKHKLKGTTGYRQFPDKYIYGELGLYEIAQKRSDVPRAKA